MRQRFSGGLVSWLAVASVLGACGEGIWRVEVGGTDPIRNGLTSADFDDGCSMEINNAFFIVYDVALANVSDVDMVYHQGEATVFDATQPVTLLHEEEIPVNFYPVSRITIGSAVVPIAGEGVSEEEALIFSTRNFGVGLNGRLICPNGSADIDWGYAVDYDFHCQTTTKISARSTDSFQFLFDPSQWFRQSTRMDGSDALLGQAVINADSNEDEFVSLVELDAVDIRLLDGYDDDPTDNIETLYDHVERLVQRSIVYGDGTTCENQRF